jgi:hypothetical protein
MMFQNAVTLRAFLKPGTLDGLEQLLQQVGEDVEDNPVLPFTAFEEVHFARFVILPEAKDLKGRTIRPSLVYAANVDGLAEVHLQNLIRHSAVGIDRIFAHCEGYPSNPDERSRFSFLQGKRIDTQAFYINTVGRSAQQVREEARLRDALESELDRLSDSARGEPPTKVRHRLQTFVRDQGDLAFATGPLPKFPLGWRIRERAEFFGTLFLLLLLAPLFLVALPFYVSALRMHETRDAQNRKPLRISAEEQVALRFNEDHVVQNQISAVGDVKPGKFRYLTMRALLWALDFAAKHHFNRGNLGTIPLIKFYGVNTIHFAQWIVIDQGRRVLFFSNYDGSLVSYMDDFVNKVAWGLNAVFSNGNHYPNTRWLVLDGAHDEQQFKAFLHKHQVRTQAWYSAHSRYTAVNLSNNGEVRRGLFAPAGSDAGAWLQRL